MSFPDHFSAHADGYAAYRPAYPAELAEWLADAAPRTALAWEAGCGSGQLSVPLASRFERVIATDASAEQLERAAPHPRVAYRPASAEASGLPEGAADLAVAAQAAHWFDLEAYYAEVRRVAAPGALVALISYGPTRIAPEIDPHVEGFRLRTLGPYWPPERRHVEDGYASLPFPFHEIRAPALEITLDWTLDELLGYVRSWSALRSMAPEDADLLLGALRRQVEEDWGATRSVRWPLAVRAGYVADRGE